MSHSNAVSQPDVNGCFLFTTKTVVTDPNTNTEKEQYTISPQDQTVRHFVEVALQWGGSRLVTVIGKVNRQLATFHDPGKGHKQQSWTSQVSIAANSIKLAHASFEHQNTGYEDVTVEVYELPPLGTKNPTPVKIDQGNLVFQIRLT
jgi:hypothetical protein